MYTAIAVEATDLIATASFLMSSPARCFPHFSGFIVCLRLIYADPFNPNALGRRLYAWRSISKGSKGDSSYESAQTFRADEDSSA